MLLDFSVSVSDFFRDPGFFKQIRDQVIPFLKTYPFVRIWHAGSATGEEVYSLAIMLYEEGLYDRCRIYATDFNQQSLEKAKSGIFPLKKMKAYTKNYIDAGGKLAFSNYYTAQYDNAIFKSFLKEKIVFAQHNLVTDQSFNEFNLILCRNVMIYFGKNLQARTHKVIYNSLSQWGILGLGDKENLTFTPFEDHYETLSQTYKLFRKVK
ncbi:MAG: CheR family methyltransferase [Desulfoplanes sp.]|nr:protein-glutamate O-methyltransferase CheR [Desulfoplanes sp.]